MMIDAFIPATVPDDDAIEALLGRDTPRLQEPVTAAPF